MEKTKRILFIDGLKGLCLIHIVVFHFLLLFLPYGFIGWGCSQEAAMAPSVYYWKYFPYSILTNASSLFVFIGISAFIPAYKYFTDNNPYTLRKQVVTRYFRLMPMSLVACLLSSIFYRTNVTPFLDFAKLTGNNWMLVHTKFDYSFLNVLKEGLFYAYLNGTELVSTLWCVQYFFLGTILVSVVLLLFGENKNRGWLYAIVAFALWKFPLCYSFLACIISADLICHKKIKFCKTSSIASIILGIVISIFPSVLLPAWLNIKIFQALGCFGIVTGTAMSFSQNAILCSKFLCKIGEKSFAGIITHILILFSVNAHLYLWLNCLHVSNYLNITINLVVYLILSYVTMNAYHFLLTPLTNYLCNAATRFFCPKTQ